MQQPQSSVSAVKPAPWEPWSKGSREEKSLEKRCDGVEEMSVGKEAIDIVQKILMSCEVSCVFVCRPLTYVWILGHATSPYNKYPGML